MSCDDTEEVSCAGNLEEVASKWKPGKKRCQVGEEIKGVQRQRKDELLNRQNLVPVRNTLRQVKNLDQEGNLL